MLTPDPARRITVRQILRHPWVAAGMPGRLTRLNETLIGGVGAVPCDDCDDPCCCDGPDEGGSFSFSALSASTMGGHSRTSSGGAAIQVCAGTCIAAADAALWASLVSWPSTAAAVLCWA